MSQFSRRAFLADVGRGMLIASVGPALACELGFASAQAAEEPKALTFGDLEPLVELLQLTPPGKLLPLLAERLKQGMDLRQLTSAAALANARAFGGEDYFGFHVFMALAPAYQMAQELPAERKPLPLFKVLYRNAHYIQNTGGRAKEVLRPIEPADLVGGSSEDRIRRAVNQGNREQAERLLAALAQRSAEDAFNGVLPGVEDNHDVHSVVMPWRAWAMLDIVGREHALTLLRQSVRQCAKRNADSKAKPEDLERVRSLVPRLLDQHRLLNGATGTRPAEDAWVDRLSETILASTAEQAGEAVAAALAEGFLPEHVGEAVSLAANQMVLRQVANWEGTNNYGRRSHGDSPGVHASDATNAWRNIARVSTPRNRAAGLILAAVDLTRSNRWALDRRPPGMEKQPHPWPEHLDAIQAKTPEALLRELDGAIRENDQIRACALMHRYGQLGHEARPALDVLLGFAISEDGRLHAEKYYRTVVEEFATTRPAFRWRQLTALARVSASAYGFSQADRKEGRAPGYEEACRLLKV